MSWQQKLKFWIVATYTEAETVSLFRLVVAKLAHRLILRESFTWL